MAEKNKNQQSGHLSGKPVSGGAVWDMPIRLFHWLLAAAVIAAIASVKNDNMFVHEKAGLTIIGLLLFRIIWGFIGSGHARFSRFLVSPAGVMAYIRRRRAGDRTYHPGHAPTGGYATMVILLVLMIMAALGLMAHDDVLYEAPLAAWAGDFSKTASLWHHRIEKLIFAIIVLHLVAIAYYRYRLGQKLIPPMVTGGHDPKAAVASWPQQIGGIVLMISMILIIHLLGYDGGRFY